MAPPPPIPIPSNFSSTNSSFIDLITPLPTRSSKKENMPPLVDVGNGSSVDWNANTRECKGKGNAKDDKRDKSDTRSNETGAGGGQAEGGDVAKDEMESVEEEELPHSIMYEPLSTFQGMMNRGQPSPRNSRIEAAAPFAASSISSGMLVNWSEILRELDSGINIPRPQPSIYVTISEDSSPSPSLQVTPSHCTT
jgi:hypothetical protein